ncbi:MAG: flagellar basal body rod protein FlgB [bacterium]
MLGKIFNAPSLKILERAMDGSSLRHKVIANNIANVNTPDYKRSDVQFGTHLMRSLQEGAQLALTHPRHQSPADDGAGRRQPRIVIDRTLSMRNDGNNVDIDVEMSKMVENSLYYEAVARQASAFFERLRIAIRGGN